MRRAIGAIVVLLSLMAASASAGEPERPAPSANDPCPLAQGVCEAVNNLYLLLGDLADADVYEGAEGFLEALARPSPDPDAVGGAPEVAAPAVEEARAPSAPQYAGSDVALPLPESPDAETDGAEQGASAVPAEQGFADANTAIDGAPLDPRGRVERAIDGIGTLTSQTNEPIAFRPRVALDAPKPTPLEPGLPGQPGTSPSADAARPPSAEGIASPVWDFAPLLALERALTPQPSALQTMDAGSPLPTVAGNLPVIAAALVISLLLLAFPLYSRLSTDRLLHHPLRAALFKAVQAKPGINIEELARIAGCSRSTAAYHLRLLARHHHLQSMGGAKAMHFYPNDGRRDPVERAQRALLASERVRAVAGYIAANPGVARKDLAVAVGIRESTLSFHVGRLLQLGLVEDRPVRFGRALVATPHLRELLAPWMPEQVVAVSAVPMPAVAFPAPAASAPAEAEPVLLAPSTV